jgi:hypothetical protein
VLGAYRIGFVVIAIIVTLMHFKGCSTGNFAMEVLDAGGSGGGYYHK